MRRRYVGFAFFLALLSAIPAVHAVDPPKQASKERPKNEPPRNAELVRPQQSPNQGKDASDERIERRNSRMKERNQEIDRMVNKQKR